MFDRRLVQNFDWGMLGLTFALGVIGLVTLYSVVNAGAAAPQGSFYLKQLLWYFIGLSAMFVTFLVDYKHLERYAYPAYFACILLLAAVLVFGKHAGGSQRWLMLGPLTLQPSELVKVAIILVLARHYSKVADTNGLTLRQLITPTVLVMIPFALIVRQPDLGTAMMLWLIAASMTLFIKIERRSLGYLLITGLLAVPGIWFFLKGYQQQRILMFLNPERDPLGAGYHIIQSKIAIGSGMLTGKGFLQGTQNALSFLPEQHTDFIFSVLAEEWGFVGGVVVLCIFLMLLVRALSIAYGCRDPFGTVLAVGIIAMIFWQVFINIGMVMGLMPVVGVTLPMISYGGSSTLAVMICFGILINISMRRFMF